MRKILSMFVLLTALQFGFSQISVGSSATEGKLRVGGGVGLNFGNNGYFGFNVSPSIGYMLTPSLEGGITVGYQYSKSDYYKSNFFSGGPYVNYYIVPGLFARGQYEYFSGNQTIISTNEKREFDEGALWLGGGYSSGGPIRLQVGLMYNVLYKDGTSIFSSPVRPFGGIAVSL